MSEVFKNFELFEESFRAVILEARDLDTLHYAETETKYKKSQLQPNYGAMMVLQDQGGVAYFTARDLDTRILAAHLFFYVSPSYHSDSLNATEDRFFVRSEYRGTGLARRLLQFAEVALKKRGVTDVFQSSKHLVGGPHIGPLLETEGYKHVAAVYHKALV